MGSHFIRDLQPSLPTELRPTAPTTDLVLGTEPMLPTILCVWQKLTLLKRPEDHGFRVGPTPVPTLEI